MEAVTEGRSPKPEKTSTGMPIALRIAAVVVIVAAPILALSLIWPGAVTVALFGVLAASLAWIPGGPKVAIGVVSALALLGALAMHLVGHTWVLALILILLGAGYGFAASRGIGSAVLQLPILVPYFMMAPPGLFTADHPVLNLEYTLAVIVLVTLAGLWTILVLHKAVGLRQLKHIEVPDRRMPILYGMILGLVSALVMIVSTTQIYNSHWVWVTLTLYILANPTQLVNWKRMSERVFGTLAGVAVITVFALIGVPDPILTGIGVVTLWACLYFMVTRKPYWQYIGLLTMTVVLMNSSGVSTVLLDLERMGFTLVGAALAILVAFAVNLIFYHRRGVGVPSETS